MDYLDELEEQSIFIIREALAQFKNPALLYSIGKDSSVLLHLLAKASFYRTGGKFPCPLLHIDTLWKFKEMIIFRDRVAAALGANLCVFSNSLGANLNPFLHSNFTDVMKTQALKMALNLYKFDAVFGGARRDEEKSRAKERIFSLRNEFHTWDPKSQRPEFWRLFNTRLKEQESMRVFPLSNWSELDIWRYILREKIPVVDLYFAKERLVAEYKGAWILCEDPRSPKELRQKAIKKSVRFRTLGCYALSGAIFSSAKNVEEIIKELENSQNGERQGRLIDKDEAHSMEKKKREGYF